MNFVEDRTFALVTADLTSNAVQYTDAVTTGATNTDSMVASATLNVGTSRDTWPHKNTRKLEWAYALFKCEFKAATSATVDMRWRVEARNASGHWKNLRQDFVVASGNDGLVMASNQSGASTTQTIDIPDATYTGDTLAAALATALTNNGTISGSSSTITWTVTYRDEQRIRIGVGTGNTIAYTLAGSQATTVTGFTTGVSAATAMTSDSNLPNQMYVGGANDAMILTSNIGGPCTVTIPTNIEYDGVTLAAAIATLLNANATLAGATPTITFTAAYTNQQRLRVAAGTGNTIALSTLTGSDAATLCGWDAVQSAATAIESTWDIPAYYEANIGTAWSSKTREGYARLTANVFDAIPAEVRVMMSASGSDEGMGRMHNDSSVRVLFELQA